MNIKAKKVVWTIIGIGFVVPFILQTTLYPFFRFGMFAEPVRYAIQEEQFLLLRISPAGKAEPYMPEKIGIGKSKLDYLLRNYYYRNEIQQMLDQLAAKLPDTALTGSIKVFRIVGQDTILVGEIVKP